jgi:hypothetical protein
MKKLIYTLMLGLALHISALPMLAAGDNSSEIGKTKVERYTKYVYDKLSFKKMNKLSYAAFSKGFYGYLNLREAGKLRPGALLTICDFSLSSNSKRIWVIDLQKKKVLYNTYVAHGSATGEEYAKNFSNVHESHQSSLGFFTTGETYQGEKGYSLKLHGHDGEFNSNAFDRGVVIHGAEYVNEAFAKANNRLGRSHGCPALPYELVQPIIDKIKGGHCLFIYHPMKSYVGKSYWLTNGIGRLPQEAEIADLNLPQATGWAKNIAEGADSCALKPNSNNAIFIPKRSAESQVSNGKSVNAIAEKPKQTNAANTQVAAPPTTQAAPTVEIKDERSFLYIR